nr:reverse transcriptase N-terminal domain-containing protein [Ktedonobacter robiniae]
MEETKAPDASSSEEWAGLPWRKLEQHQYRLQKRIFKASERGDLKTVHQLQKLLMKSRSARLLAVRRVTQDNQGKKTAGIDGIKSVQPTSRFAMVEAIHPKRMSQRKPQPLRRVWIPKPGKTEQRPLGIPICVAHCLSFQAMFGIPCVLLLVDRKIRSTIIVLLYHRRRCLLGLVPLPFPLDGLA